jgi:hypothetical protein
MQMNPDDQKPEGGLFLDLEAWKELEAKLNALADTPVDNESLLHRAQAGDVELALTSARRANPD